jgi:hypothetical protein
MSAAQRMAQLRDGSWECCCVVGGFLMFEEGSRHEPIPEGSPLAGRCALCVPWPLRTSVASVLGLSRLDSPCECVVTRAEKG